MSFTELPKHWKWVRLGDVSSGVEYGSAAKSKATGQIPVLRMGNIQNGKFDWSDLVYTSDEAEIKKYLLKKNDVLFNRTNSPELVGKTAIFKGERPAIFAGYLIRINRIESLMDADYLAYFLNSHAARNYGGSVKSFGVNQSNINGTKLKNYPLPLPPLAEQQRIVAKLEALFSELDAGLASLNTAAQQLKNYRQAVLKWAFEGGAGSKDVRLDEVCEFITKGTTPSKSQLFSREGEIPFLKVYNLTFNGSLDFSIEPTFVTNETHRGFLNRSRVLSGDVLMNIVGPPLGKVSIVPTTYPEWNINQAIARFRCKDLLLNKYLLYFLVSEHTIRQYSKRAKATAGQFNLTLEICRNISIPLCSLEEQHRIVQEIESRLSVCDKLEETLAAARKQAEALRQSILKQAFAGKLVAPILNADGISA